MNAIASDGPVVSSELTVAVFTYPEFIRTAASMTSKK